MRKSFKRQVILAILTGSMPQTASRSWDQLIGAVLDGADAFEKEFDRRECEQMRKEAAAWRARGGAI